VDGVQLPELHRRAHVEEVDLAALAQVGKLPGVMLVTLTAISVRDWNLGSVGPGRWQGPNSARRLRSFRS
jgi:hypothetical protein